MSEEPSKSTDSNTNHQLPWLLGFAAAFLISVAVAVVVAVTYGFSTGRLMPYWNALGDGRGEIIGHLLTIYAAAFASVFLPLIFRGQINDLKKQISEVTLELRQLSNESKNSFKVLNDYALQSAGLKTEYSIDDLPEASRLISKMQTRASAICQEILDGADLHGKTKALFNNKWAGNKPFVKLLFEKIQITENERDKFFEISESTKFTRENGSNATLADLNILAAAMNEISKLHELRKARWEGRNS